MRKRRSLGIDLAVNPSKTALAEIEWADGVAHVQAPRTRCVDGDIVSALTGLGPEDSAGIDCPFGWPQAFVEAVAAHAAQQRWPGHRDPVAHYELSRMRVTDRLVDGVVRRILKRGPLSVSMDKLGAAAWRWACLADQLATDGHPVDRSGAGRIAEVYPAGARAVWGLQGDRSIERLLAVAPWLRFAPGARAVFDQNEHAFDALVAALVARAAVLGLTVLPAGEDERHAAQVEGWIHLPVEGSLPKLI
ncbi:DUF429 domain-containing protein [Streptomyces hyaluromycini]|uniref:DUF429 domain-containing protein n=1 Tax=Streptomyces hyaluromycini TaxID=1377993 RepID=UPI000B5CD7C3|nr:DUF429 domain-containing protein [Streptomyces hyaluromycini]